MPVQTPGSHTIPLQQDRALILVLPITLFLRKCSSSLLDLSTAAESNGNITGLLSYPWQNSSALVPKQNQKQLHFSQLSLKQSQKLSSGQHQILSRNTSAQTQQQSFSFPYSHPQTSPRREAELYFKILLFKVLCSSPLLCNNVPPTSESPSHIWGLQRQLSHTHLPLSCSCCPPVGIQK